MALTIYENKEATGAKVKIDRRVYQNAEGKLVEEGDPKARVLYCSAGKFVDRADFEARGGVVDVVKAEPEPEVKAKPKAKAAPKSKKKES